VTVEELELEVIAVRPSQSVWTVDAQSLQDGTLYGVAIDPRMGAAILEVLSDPGETPPVLLGIEEWQVRWTLQPDAQDDYWSNYYS